ncbi:uncharacterized protein N7500_008863 [Penicillium coprophilum]|uniref:uncharacterized protein n=1 Tax=Penicillium coprophilum TaxID=36646 RepID=UPI00239854AB|nr:uncharacterized protein N7500_008863 [Penicillium coprophilum]KAJ5159212.1 hypothetical protein N7500_008863 [Penicillium coprophilum]
MDQSQTAILPQPAQGGPRYERLNCSIPLVNGGRGTMYIYPYPVLMAPTGPLERIPVLVKNVIIGLCRRRFMKYGLE